MGTGLGALRRPAVPRRRACHAGVSLAGGHVRPESGRLPASAGSGRERKRRSRLDALRRNQYAHPGADAHACRELERAGHDLGRGERRVRPSGRLRSERQRDRRVDAVRQQPVPGTCRVPPSGRLLRRRPDDLAGGPGCGCSAALDRLRGKGDRRLVRVRRDNRPDPRRGTPGRWVLRWSPDHLRAGRRGIRAGDRNRPRRRLERRRGVDCLERRSAHVRPVVAPQRRAWLSAVEGSGPYPRVARPGVRTMRLTQPSARRASVTSVLRSSATELQRPHGRHPGLERGGSELHRVR